MRLPVISVLAGTCFSPLLDGDGVASAFNGTTAASHGFRFSPLLDGDGVASVRAVVRGVSGSVCFSPLLDGDGVASECIGRRKRRPSDVSVPFSMGTVLLPIGLCPISATKLTFQSPSRWGRCCFTPAVMAFAAAAFGFSPLLDGDGVASIYLSICCYPLHEFQSPSRWGRCCFCADGRLSLRLAHVSVPFSMGTVLLLLSGSTAG